MQVQYAYQTEGCQEMLAHTSKSWVVEVAMICDVSEEAQPGHLDTNLAKSNELHIIVLEPFRLGWLGQFRNTALVVVNFVNDPLDLVVKTVARVRRIPDNDCKPLSPLDLVDCLRLVRERRKHTCERPLAD